MKHVYIVIKIIQEVTNYMNIYLYNNIMFVLKLTLDYFLKNKLKIIIYFLIIALTYPFESLVISKNISKLSQTIPNFTKQKPLIIKLIMYICIFWSIIKIANILKHYIEDYIYPQFYLSMRKFMFDNILKRYREDYKDISVGEVLTNIIFIPGAVKHTVMSILTALVPSIMTILFINGYFLTKSYKLFLLSISAPITALVLYALVGVKCVEKARVRDIFFGNMNENIKDKLSNLFAIYTDNNIEQEIKDYHNLEKTYLDIDLETKNCNNKLFTLLNVSAIIFFIAIMILLFVLRNNKQINSETFITCLVMLTYYFIFINSFAHELPYLNTNIGQLINAEDFLKDITKKYKESDPNIKNKINKGHIRVNHVSFKYNGMLKNILTNISFVVKPRESVAIFGKSGSGKTTIIKLLMGFYKINKGTITIDNTDLYDYNLGYLRNNISYVNQGTQLFNNTILENIKYGMNISDKEVRSFVKKYNITIFNKLEKGLHTNVGVNGNLISGGQKHVVLLIKAFLKTSKLYILDEPITGLDNKIKNQIMTLIRDLSKDKTVIIISHDNDIKKIVNRVIHFKGGE
uniref:ABC transporter domain-containing protein n=1 Tax=viral metagenome TaxID=1070528 RepID=A0A6C0B4L6_9ZZZZ